MLLSVRVVDDDRSQVVVEAIGTGADVLFEDQGNLTEMEAAARMGEFSDLDPGAREEFALSLAPSDADVDVRQFVIPGAAGGGFLSPCAAIPAPLRAAGVRPPFGAAPLLCAWRAEISKILHCMKILFVETLCKFCVVSMPDAYSFGPDRTSDFTKSHGDVRRLLKRIIFDCSRFVCARRAEIAESLQNFRRLLEQHLRRLNAARLLFRI